jgi:uroporphyrinogen decarboxylase
MVMIFDTWGGLLAPDAYREFSLAYMRQVLEGLIRSREGERVPNLVFSKGAAASLEAIGQSGCDAVGIDWTQDLGTARQRAGKEVALQGNLDPAVLLSSPEAVRGGVAAVLAQYGPGTGHVFNLGHGISRFTPPENVTALVDAVHELSRPYH